MKISETWLRELVATEHDLSSICNALTMAGLEVEDTSYIKANFNNAVVGYVKTVIDHPDASRLHVCTVDVGKEELLQIVCGATNVREGLKVPVALVDAVLPNGVKIKKAKLRGVESNGMICSAVELGLAESSNGILELPCDAPVGLDMAKYLSLNDAIVELNITPNRSDCLSVIGVAREVAAICLAKIIEPCWQPIKTTIKDQMPCEIKSEAGCSRYVSRIIKNIDNNISTPIPIQERLRRLGVRPISLVVDVANYVMLEYGQPLHVFDLAKIGKKVNIRCAKNNEELTLLDNICLQLTENDLIIADDSNPLALAGIMGGKNSAVDSNTTEIFVESALFSAPMISKSARRHNLHTDASHRFERGVDPMLQVLAMERFTYLLNEFTQGKILVSDYHEYASEQIGGSKSILITEAMIDSRLGVRLSPVEVEELFNRLGMRVEKKPMGFIVVPPSFRLDINIAEDLIEELARVYGYDNIPEVELSLPLVRPKDNLGLENRKRLAAAFVDLGYREVITYSFVDPKLQNLLFPGSVAMILSNPISPEMSAMRVSLWPGLIQTVIYNKNRQQDRLRLFEIGQRFATGADDALQQINTLSGIVVGNTSSKQWAESEREVDFFDVKNDIEKCLSLFAKCCEINFRVAAVSALHPNVAAEIIVNGNVIGIVGKMHPGIVSQLDLDNPIYLFELNLSFLLDKFNIKFKPISKFPLVERDIAIVISKDIVWSAIREKVLAIDCNILQNIELFDIYCGAGIEQGKQSLAIRLSFHNLKRTLTEPEVDDLCNKIIRTLESEFNAQLRA